MAVPIKKQPIQAAFGDTFGDVRMDAATHVLTTISYAHHETHSGNFYRTAMNFTLGNGNVCALSFITPNSTKWCHMTWELSDTADGTFDLLEDVTSFAGGVATVPVNKNRNSRSASGAVCTRGMTGADPITPTGGTAILDIALATGKGNTASRTDNAEYILKQNSKYLFRYTNGANANVVHLILHWYEHTDKD